MNDAELIESIKRDIESYDEDIAYMEKELKVEEKKRELRETDWELYERIEYYEDLRGDLIEKLCKLTGERYAVIKQDDDHFKTKQVDKQKDLIKRIPCNNFEIVGNRLPDDYIVLELQYNGKYSVCSFDDTETGGLL